MKKTTISLLCGIILASTAQAQTIKCWTNDDGTRACGTSLPPEAAQRGYDRLTIDGQSSMGGVKPAPSKEVLEAERALAAEAERQKAERDRIAAEAERRNNVLLHTFATEDELLSARDSQTGALDTRIQQTGALIRQRIRSVRRMEEQAAALERAGREIDEKLVNDIYGVLTQVSQQRAQVSQLEDERVEILQRFDRNLQRYRRLKQGDG